MLRLSIAEQFEDLRLVSDNVTDYLTRELFKDTFGPDTDYSVNDILKECYALILQELKDFGISFSLSDDELLEDWYTAKRVYFVRKIVDSAYLKHTLTDSDEIQKLEASLEDDEIDSSFFQLLIECLSPNRKKLPEFSELVDFAVFVVSNERFEAHVRAILEYLREIDAPIVIPDVVKATEYIKKIQAGRIAARNAVDKAISGIPLVYANMDKRIITKLLTDYDMDKISAENIRIYSFIDVEEVDENLQAYKSAMMQKHHERSPHHLDYWITTWKNPQPILRNENILLLVAHHAEPGVAAPEFWIAIEKMLQDGLALFSPEQVDLINIMAAAIFPRS